MTLPASSFPRPHNLLLGRRHRRVGAGAAYSAVLLLAAPTMFRWMGGYGAIFLS
jgi:hypothetical protein